MITVACPNCLAKFRAPDGFAGKRAKCPKCFSVIAIPNGATDSVFPAIQPGNASTAPGEVPCPFCGELIKAIAKKCRFCHEMIEERDGSYRVEGVPATATLASCPKCHSNRTSEYMPTRWKCLHCETEFILERAPSIVLQPTKETVIHQGPTNTRKLKREVEPISGVRRGLGPSKGNHLLEGVLMVGLIMLGGLVFVCGGGLTCLGKCSDDMNKRRANEDALLHANIGAEVTLSKNDGGEVWLFETESNYRSTMKDLGYNMFELKDKGISRAELRHTDADFKVPSGTKAKVVLSRNDCSLVEILGPKLKGTRAWVSNSNALGLPNFNK